MTDLTDSLTNPPPPAMILAAGLGTRMRAYSSSIPKPLVSVAGSSLIEHILDRLATFGIARVVINLHWQGDQIRQRIESRPLIEGHQRPEVIFSPEDTILETGGGIKRALPLLDSDHFLVINSDVFWLDGLTPTLGRLLDSWHPDLMDVLLLVVPLRKAIGHRTGGDFHVTPEGKLVSPAARQRIKAPFIFTGLAVVAGHIYHDTPSDEPFSQLLVWRRSEAQGRLYGLIHEGLWFHIGTPEALTQSRDHLARLGFPSDP